MQLLDGEREWLTQVVTNPCNDLLKLVYADWLQEQGDEERAHFLRAFVEASQSMNPAAFPQVELSGDEWRALIGYYLLKEAADLGLRHAKEPLLKLARPAITFITNPRHEKLPAGASKVGGWPDLPPGFAWPTANECHRFPAYAMSEENEDEERLAGFVAQINLSHLSGFHVSRELPPSGLLSFFAFCADEVGNRYWYPDEVSARCFYFPDANRLVSTDAPDELDGPNTTAEESSAVFIESLQLPEPFGPWEEDFTGIGRADFHELVSILREPMVDNHLLGYSWTVDGNDPTPSKQWRHLLNVNRYDFAFEFQIPQPDLLAGNFDAVRLLALERR